ncbi:MAG: sigma-70 family RNA polymerase sigma factor [Saprospiraceae bacterium]|jgi:RNA polymerase sigma factor (sigma-70 family)|nr:sigma-70 family RNA polymerase sigma factor [Saprospiraceae bacterium]
MNDATQKKFFREVIEQHQGILHKVARSYCKDEEDKQDLIQEMLIQIWQSIPRYNNDYKISTWLYRIALNVAISFYRKNTQRQKPTLVNPHQAENIHPAEQSEADQQVQILLQFINELKVIDKALMLLHLEEKSYKEIADITGLSETNVATKIGRIKIQLKHKFSSINTKPLWKMPN